MCNEQTVEAIIRTLEPPLVVRIAVQTRQSPANEWSVYNGHRDT